MKGLRVRQICFFFVAFLPVTKIFLLPSIYARFAGADMWLSTLLNIILDVLSLTCIITLWKRFDCKGFFEILTESLGKTTAKIIFFFYFLYFLIKSYIPLSEQKSYVEVTLYENTATLMMFLPVFIFGAYLATKKASVLGRSADLLAIITIIGFALLFFLSISNAEFGHLLPIGVNGAGKITKGVYYALPWFGDAVYFLFLMGDTRHEKGTVKKMLISYAVAGLIVVFFMILFYSTFSSIAVRQSFALTEISKYSIVINNIGRFDYIGIFCILLSGIFALSLPVYFAAMCLRKVFEIKQKLVVAIIISFVVFLVIVFTNEYLSGVQKFIETYLGGFTFLMNNVLPATFLLLRRKNAQSIKV